MDCDGGGRNSKCKKLLCMFLDSRLSIARPDVENSALRKRAAIAHAAQTNAAARVHMQSNCGIGAYIIHTAAELAHKHPPC
eukprot:scaffold47767_cov36-Tisochrysis_lutea.AAC.3